MNEQRGVFVEHTGIVLELDAAMHFRLRHSPEGAVWPRADRGRERGAGLDEFALVAQEIHEQAETDLGQAERFTISGGGAARRRAAASYPDRRRLPALAWSADPAGGIRESFRWPRDVGSPGRYNVAVGQLTNAAGTSALRLLVAPGAAVEWGQDFAFPLSSSFSVIITWASEGAEGGGIPLVYLWNREGGVALAHIEPVPQLCICRCRQRPERGLDALENRAGLTLPPVTVPECADFALRPSR
jgi:hypothetical protein